MKTLIILDGDSASGKTTYADWYGNNNPGVAIVSNLTQADAMLAAPDVHTVILDPEGKPFDVEIRHFTVERRTVWLIDGESDYYREEMGQ